MEQGMLVSDSLAVVQEDPDASSISYQSKDSRRTITTTSLSSINSSPPCSPSTVARRRRAQQQQQQEISLTKKPGMPTHRRDGSPLFVLPEQKCPSLSTATNTSGTSGSISYTSSEREIEEHDLSYGEESAYSRISLNSFSLETSHHGEFDPRGDLEMGIFSVNDNSRLSPRNGPPSPSQQAHWKHQIPGRQRFYSTNSFTPPSVTSSISSSSVRSRRSRASTIDLPHPMHFSGADRKASAASKPQPLKSGPFRASLDAGMAAMRSWVSSRGTATTSEITQLPEMDDSKRKSRGVLWQSGQNPGSSSSVLSQNTGATGEELDDLLQLDDMSTQTNHSSKVEDGPAEPASAPSMFISRHQPRNSLAQINISHPDTIIEEFEEGGGDGCISTENRLRKRSQSEPDGRQILGFFFSLSPSTNLTGSSRVSRPKRRLMHSPKSNNRRHYTSYHNPPQQHDIPDSPSRRRIPRRIDTDVGASLSSSAAAALSENPQSQSTANSFFINYSDDEASVAAADSTRELAVTPSGTGTSELADVPVHGSPYSDVPPSSFRNTRNIREDGALFANSTSHGRAIAVDTTMVQASSSSSSHRESVRSNSAQVTDSERLARIRWIRINRRFQFVITVVALIFSLLLFAILICWVVLTSSYFLSFDKSCDVPLKQYFWLVTLQLVLDVFRSDIMRIVFNWDANSNQRIPVRVIAYNVTYLIYALLVLRLGIRSVFVDATTCSKTTPELYNASTAFVSLSIAAWATILCGYLLPFCVVAILLTCNGYNPTSHNRLDDQTLGRERGTVGAPGTAQPVFPAAYATTGAPPGTIDRLSVIGFDSIGETSKECCVCMEEFTEQDMLVELSCKHIFHKQCCREWLRQARTCPVCRSDIPESLQATPPPQVEPDPSSRIPIGPTGRPVVGLFRILHRTAGAVVRTSSPSHAVRRVANEERAIGA